MAETESPNETSLSGMITSKEAAAICGMTVTTFRKAVTRQQALKDARVKITESLSLFDQTKIEAWAKKRKRYAPREE